MIIPYQCQRGKITHTRVLLKGGERTKNNIKELRKRAGLTQKQLAERIQVNQTAVSQWETGRCYPSAKILQKLAEILGSTADELLRCKEIKEQMAEANGCSVDDLIVIPPDAVPKALREA